MVGLGGHGAWSIVLVSSMAVVLGAQELGQLPHLRRRLYRQTSKTWRHRLTGGGGAAVGLDLGSGLTTMVRFPSYWLIPTAAFVHGSPGYGATVFVMYAVGKFVPFLAVSLTLIGDDVPVTHPASSIVRAMRALRAREHRLHPAAAVIAHVIAITGLVFVLT